MPLKSQFFKGMKTFECIYESNQKTLFTKKEHTMQRSAHKSRIKDLFIFRKGEKRETRKRLHQVESKSHLDEE